MPGTLCGPEPVTTLEALKALLADKGGQTYYRQMQSLPVDPRRLERGLTRIATIRNRTWLEQCARCGVCAPSCAFFLAANDARQSPAYKIQSTLGELLRCGGRVDTAFMIRAMDVAWGQCTCCNRCGVYCPLGVDTGVLMSALREILFEQGFVPWEMKIGAGMHRVFGAQMDISTEDWLETCAWLVEEYATDWPDLRIPVDRPDADILYVLNAREAKHYPQDVAAAAMLFQLAGADWTMAGRGWDSTSLSLFAGDREGCVRNVERVYDAVARLRPRMVVGTECGHAYRATVLEGPYWAGRADGTTPVPFLHYVEWLAGALRSGQLTVDPARRIKEPITVQDACNYVRGGGLGRYVREILGHIAEDVREMPHTAEHAFCCGGGGGLNGVGRYRQNRDAALRVRYEHIRATGAQRVVTPCHNCWDAVRDMRALYAPELRWSLLKPLVLDCLVLPPGRRGAYA